MEESHVSSDARIEDPHCADMSSGLEPFNNDQSDMMRVSDTIEEEYKEEGVNNCFSQNVTKTKDIRCQPQVSEDESCTEKSKFLLIDDQGVPYTVFKDDIISSLQDVDDLDDLSSEGPRRLHYCPMCFRSFLYVSDLERHSITHSECKPFECKVCGKTFKRSSHLQRHKHIHTGARPFLCNICRKGFRESGELQRHQRVHTGEKPYQCEICYVRFTERNTLRRHMKRKHTIQALFRQVAADNSDWEENFMKSLLDDSVL
ncbi:PREDICTED: zinc finger protein 524-like [Nanorana parkeri]|uniref:zinc finger protein 524-like n=1 Tax=Nanorana parkeri TaxID=125878 RepID=UPI000854101C|nr:PREDICTED: zinc finger protein 524-like [Nanorana parkeri]